MTQGNPQSEVSGTGPSTDWEALARHVTGESSPEESERIDAWLAGHPDQREILATLDNALSRMADDLPADLDIEGALQRVKARRSSINKPALLVHSGGPAQRKAALPRWRVPFPAVAAAALLGISVLGYGAIRDGPATQPAISAARMLATGVGVRDSMRLPDGTRVILGPLSSLTISNGYGETDRVVDVRGDAWFDVVHDNSRPFTVRAGEATIVDIGTKFMVRNDAGQAVSVSVTEGSVSMRAADDLTPDDGVILKAGDHAVVEAGRVVAHPGTVGEDDLAWMSGRLVFRETAMSEVIASMHRWYGIELRVSDSSLLSRNITATFAGESPDRILEVLRLVLGANIERRGDTAVITPRDGSTRSR